MEFDIKYVNGHYEMFINGEWYSNYGTYDEAKREENDIRDEYKSVG